MSVKIGVVVMAVLLALYIALVGWRAVLLLGTGESSGSFAAAIRRSKKLNIQNILVIE